ncbi:MAG: hypothetical protein JNM56_38775, partial [Planctomycetia bacterium]|nr:hypothetical protein [Planctomycetia bacterium]
MTEQEWLSSVAPRELFAVVEQRLTGRQKRLFTIACGQRYCRVFTREKYLDASAAEYWLARKPQIDDLCAKALDAASVQCDGTDCKQLIESLREQVFQLSPLGLNFDLTAALTGNLQFWLRRADRLPGTVRAMAKMDANEVQEAQSEVSFQADLLRHLVGNPFRPHPAPVSWPPLVVDLAWQLYAGADVRLILHDALLDAGHDELAEHFRVEEW